MGRVGVVIIHDEGRGREERGGRGGDNKTKVARRKSFQKIILEKQKNRFCMKTHTWDLKETIFLNK